MIDADGSVLGLYRKSHIPDGPGYQEKYYFTPGDTGFRVWDTRFGRIGCGICWDQWFPECARAMALMGAEILCYPTAIGSEPPPAPPVDSSAHWRRVMQGHAGANDVPLVASNRIGREVGEGCEITFYGTSFIAGPTAATLAMRRSQRFVAQLGLALEIVGIVGLGLTISTSVSGWIIAFWLVIYGIGVGYASAQLTGLILADVPVRKSGQASGTQSTARQLGSALGTAILGTVLFLSLSKLTYNNLANIPGLDDGQRQQMRNANVEQGEALVADLPGDLVDIGLELADALLHDDFPE
jgi:hypothetical protein